MIEVCDLHAGILRGVSLRLCVPGAQLTGIVGPNGAGKSTLLHALLSPPRSGAVVVDGEDVRGMRRRAVARRLALVAQREEEPPPLTAAEYVRLGRIAAGTDHGHTAVTGALAATDALQLARRRVITLSGGELQRVHIARGIAQEARYLLLDEPTNHLDARHTHDVLHTLRDLPRPCVAVLHDLNAAARYCEEVVVLDDGSVAAVGAPTDVLRPEVLEPIYSVRMERIETPRGFLLDAWRGESGNEEC